MSSNVSAFMFDETWAKGPWKAYRTEEFSADEIVCKGPCFFGLDFSPYVEYILVGEEKGKGNVSGRV